jgi:L-asparagine oxygenase
MVGAPDSFMDRGEACSVPVLVPDGCGGFYSRYNQGLTRGTNSAACAALDEMARALDDGTVVHRLDIEAGDIVILDNWRTLHMRPDFKPRWDGYDRWLLRVYAAERVMRGVSTSKDWPRCWR